MILLIYKRPGQRYPDYEIFDIWPETLREAAAKRIIKEFRPLEKPQILHICELTARTNISRMCRTAQLLP